MPYIPPENELDYIIDEDENEEELELLDDDDNENEADYTSYDYDGPNDIGVPDPNTSGGTPASEEEEETKYVVTYKDRALITSAEPAYLYELFQSGATFYAIYDDDTEEEVSWDEIEDLNPIDTLVDLGEAIASATNQHFWNDDQGVHVAEINKESWQIAMGSNFSDLSSSKNYYNLLTNSLGLLFRRALYNLVAITRTSISFYDGTGNQSSNVMAYFGRDSAQIGRNNAKHLSLDSEGITAYNADGTVAPIQAANISAAEANIEQLQAATADISTIRANSAKVASLTADALTAATAYIAALNTLNVTANDISADKATLGSLITGSVTTDTLKAASAYISALNSANVTANDISANKATINSLIAGTVTADTIRAASAYVSALTSASVTADDISANKATINSLIAGDVTADTIRAASAYIAALTSASVTANDISANKATLGALIAGNVTTDTLRAASAYISALTTSNISASTITADHANVTTIIADYLTSADIQAEQIRVGQLLAGYVETDFSNADVAWIENGTIKDGAITNAMINSVSANKLTAGTIDASNITVTNLNADNITTGTINGQRIGEGSLSLSKLEDDVYTESEVDSMLSAMQAEIDGAIETWTGTAVPTLNNTPASGWTTNAIKDTHVGDVYFVVNSQSQQNGYNYRFTKSGSGSSATYSWQLIKDNDVTNALQRITDAEGRIGTIETFDQSVTSWQTQTEGTISSMQSAHTTLAGRVDTAEGTLATKVDTSTFNTLSQTVEGNSSSITQLTTEQTTLNGLVSTALEDSVEYIVGTQSGASGAWTGVTRESSLVAGKTIAYKLPYNGSGNASLQLTLSDGTLTDNIPVYTNTTRVTTHFGAGAVITMTYDGQYWRTQSIPNTNNIDRILHNNSLFSASQNATGKSYAVVGASIIGYISALNGYQTLLVGSVVDITRPILWGSGNVAPSTAFTNAYEAIPSATIRSNTNSTWTGTQYSIAYIYGTLSNNSFTVVGFTSTVPTSEDGYIYLPLGQLADTYRVYFVTPKEKFAYIDGVFQPVELGVKSQVTKTITKVNEVVDTVDEHTQKIGSLETTVATKADNSTVTTVSNNLSTLSQTVDTFQTTVASTYATKESVDNIQIGGRNLLISTPTAYSKTSYNVYRIPTSVSLDEFSAGDNITLQLWGVDLDSGSSGLRAYWGGGSVSITSTSFSPDATGYALVTIKILQTWLGHADASNKSIWIYNFPANHTGSSLTIDRWKLEKGNKGTDWTPAPEDMATDSALSSLTTRVSTAESTIEQHNTSIALKANSADVYTKTQTDGLISTEVTNRNAAIQVAVDGINSTVSSTYATKESVNKDYSKTKSRGEQLITNGNGMMGDNTNFSALIFDGSKSNGSPGSFTKSAGTSAEIIIDEYFPVDPSKEYEASFDVLSSGDGANSRMYAQLYMYDVDKKLITVQCVSYFPNTTTTLAQDLKPEDTIVHLTDASNWHGTSAPHQRSLIFWNYTNSAGYLYPIGTYSRNYYAGVYENDSSVDKQAGTITLSSPWSGKTISAGTPVSQNSSGGSYAYFWFDSNGSKILVDEWLHASGLYSGTKGPQGANSPVPPSTSFWHGTAYCKIGWLWNYQSSTTGTQRRLWVTNVSMKIKNASIADVNAAVEAIPRMAKINMASRNFTLSQWNNYGAVGHVENWSTGSTYDNSHLRVGDRAYLIGTISDKNAGSATIIGEVTNVVPTGVGTSYITLKTEQLIFGGDVVTAVESRVTTAESTIEQHDASIALKANSADVYTKTQSDGLISTEVTNRNAAISAATQAIELSVSELYTTKTEFSNLEIGGRNLLRHTSHPEPKGLHSASIYDTDGWYVWNNSATLERTSDGIKIAFSDTSYSGPVIPLSSDDVLVGETDYILSFDARGTYASASVVYALARSGSNWTTNSIPAPSLSTTEWTHIEIPVKWLSFGSRKARAVMYPYTNASGTWIEIRDGSAKLEKGTKPTDWTPAPEDMASQTDLAAAKAAIKVTTDGITSEVEKKTDKASIISTINQSAESVKIQASKVDITGEAVFSAINNDTGTTKINGGKIDATAITIGQSQVTGLSTALNGKADDSDISAIQDDLNSSRVWYAVCDTVAATVAKVATISPATTDFTLEIGRMVNVRFVNTNTGAVGSLTLNVNDTGAKPIKNFYNGGVNNLSSAGYLKADSIITFKYDGTNWVTDLTVNSTYNQGISQLYNTIKAKTSITKESIIVGDANGYSMAAAGVSFDLSYPILWTTVNINANGTNYANIYTSYHDRNLATNHGFSSGTPNSIVYLVGTVTGNTFTLASSYLTTTVPASENGYCYIPIGRLGDTSTGGNYFYFFCVDKPTLYTYKDGSFGPASIREASAAAKTATNYISLDSTGIRIANANPATATTYQHQTAANTEFIVDGVSSAEFSGSGGRIGSYNGIYTVLNNNQLTLAGYANKIFSVEVEDVTPVPEGDDPFESVTETSATVNRASGVTDWYISINQLWIPFIRSITNSNNTLVENTDYILNKVDGTIYIRSGINTVTINYYSIPTKDYNTSLTLYDGKGIGTNNKLMKISNDSTVIGKTSNSHVQLDYHSMQLIDKGGTTYFYVSDLRDETGVATITERFYGDGSTTVFAVSLTVSTEVSATVSNDSNNTATRNGSAYVFTSAPSVGSVVTIVYKTTSDRAKAYTLGRRYSSNLGPYSMAEGINTDSTALCSHAEGFMTKASGNYAHAEGNTTEASSTSSHAEGDHTEASGMHSHAEGNMTKASKDNAHAEGYHTLASGNGSHAEGFYANATVSYAHAEGSNTNATGYSSHAEGRSATSSGDYSHAEGNGTASGHYSHVEGGGNTASGHCSHAEGGKYSVDPNNGMVSTLGNIASGIGSHAEGILTQANGEASHAGGYYTVVASNYQTAIGKYNDNSSSNAFEIGNGTGDDARSNALTVDWSGNVDISGGLVSDGAIISSDTIQAHDGREIFGGTSGSVLLQHKDANNAEDFRIQFYIDSNGHPALRGSLDGGTNWEYPYANQYASRTANTVWAAPNGSAGAASFRALVAADIPNLNASKITDGSLDIPGSVTSDGAITSGAAIYAHDGREIFGGTDALVRIYHRDASNQEDFRFDFYIDGNGNPAMRASLDAGSSWKYPYLNQLSSRTANTVLAGPNGSNGAPSFRALVADDIPNLNASKITAGTLGTARGGTGVSGRQSSTITVDTSNVTVGDTNHCWHNGVVCSFSYNFKTKASLANNGTLTVGTLPSGYRPPYTFVGSAYTSTASAQADVSISTAGVITIRNVSGAAIATSVTIRVGGTFAL